MFVTRYQSNPRTSVFDAFGFAFVVLLYVVAIVLSFGGCLSEAKALEPAKRAAAVKGYGVVYYEVGEAATAAAVELATKPLRDELATLKAEVAALKQKIASGPASSGSPPADQPAGPTDPATPGKWEPAAIFKTHCVRCHSASNKQGGVDYTDRELYVENVVRGFKQAYLGQMPKAGPLGDEDVRAVLEELIRVVP